MRSPGGGLGEGPRRIPLLLHGPALRRAARIRHATGHATPGALDAARELAAGLLHAGRHARDASRGDTFRDRLARAGDAADGRAGALGWG